VAKTKRKRQKKHRGTQGGRVSTKPKGRPRSRAEARQRATQKRSSSTRKAGQRSQRGLTEPTWKGALGKGALASVLFFFLFAAIFKRPVGASAGFAAFMLAFYVPMSYYLDAFFYRRRMRQEAARKAEQQ
jgi:hypothetical protein